jgi:hypothetical protein
MLAPAYASRLHTTALAAEASIEPTVAAAILTNSHSPASTGYDLEH